MCRKLSYQERFWQIGPKIHFLFLLLKIHFIFWQGSIVHLLVIYVTSRWLNLLFMIQLILLLNVKWSQLAVPIG